MRIFFLLLLASLASARAQELEFTAEQREKIADGSLPPGLEQRFQKSGLGDKYILAFAVTNPFYLSGDFDGDGRLDYVVHLQEKAAPARREDVVFFAKGAPRLISKDTEHAYPGPFWYIVPKHEKVGQSAFEDEGKSRPSCAATPSWWWRRNPPVRWFLERRALRNLLARRLERPPRSRTRTLL